MGSAVATRLASQGFPVAAWNRSPRTQGAALPPGITLAATATGAAQNAAVVITLLADGDALLDVLAAGLADALGGKTLIEMSTIGPTAARKAADLVRHAGGRYVDAPVSGTVGPALRGELVGLVGVDEEEDLEAARPALDVLCKRLLRAGGVGHGQALKVALNGLGAHHFVAFASMLAVAEGAGIPRQVAVEAFTQGAFASPSYVAKKAKVLAADYTPEFRLRLALKDTDLAQRLAANVGVEAPVLDALRGEIAAAVDCGLGDDDLFGMERYFQPRHHS